MGSRQMRDGKLTFWALVLRVAYLMLWEVLSAVWWCFQRMVWFFTGVSQQMWSTWEPEGYHYSAHVQDIAFRFKFDEFFGCSRRQNFITIHREFADPCILLKDNVTLYDVNEREAVFIESDEGTQLWRSEFGSFVRLAQFYHGRRMITIPIQHFHRFAEEVGDPVAQVIFLPNVGRCGSTLLAQAFECTDRCVVYSEPYVLNAVSFFRNKGYPQSFIDVIARDVLRVLCKPVTLPHQVDAFVLKPQAPSTDCVTLFGRVCLQSKQLFMWRDRKEAAESLERLLFKLPTFYLSTLIPRVLDPLTVAVCTWKNGQHSGIFPEDYLDIIRYPLLSGIFVFARVMARYKHFYDEGYKVAGVRYEDLVENPRFAMEAIFSYCNLDSALVPRALRAFERDSQLRSPFSKDALRVVENSTWTKDACAAADRVFERYGMPGLDDRVEEVGVITAPRVG